MQHIFFRKHSRLFLVAHVEQKGSLVTPDRLRFDFAHFQAMTPEEIAETEDTCKQRDPGSSSSSTQTSWISKKQRRSGAMALFGEKYDQKVRVVSMGDFSKELCGGTHVKNYKFHHALQDRI